MYKSGLNAGQTGQLWPAGTLELPARKASPVRDDRWPAVRPRPTARRRARNRVPLHRTTTFHTMLGATATIIGARPHWHRNVSIANLGGNDCRRQESSTRVSCVSWRKKNVKTYTHVQIIICLSGRLATIRERTSSKHFSMIYIFFFFNTCTYFLILLSHLLCVCKRKKIGLSQPVLRHYYNTVTIRRRR